MPELYAHQLEGARLLVENPRYALFWEMGCGKTGTVLSAIKYLHQRGEASRVLVVCPLSIINPAWRKDAGLFAPELTVAGWHDKLPRWSKAPRFGEANINIINFESFRKIAEDKSVWDMLVVDESSKMKDPRSKISKALRAFAHRVRRVVLLSGTPAPNDPLEYWAQIYAIDPEVLGSSYYAFRHHYGKAKRIYLGSRYVDQYSADPKKVPAMLERIATVSHTLRKADCMDLPDKVDEIIEIDLSTDERKAYETMQRDLILRFDDGDATADNVLAEAMKLRQIANGWCYDTQHKPKIIGRSKINALIDVLDQINSQAVIWIEFREDADRIKHLLGERACCLVGGMSEQGRAEAIEAFTSGKCRYLVAHPQSAGHGLTFVNAHYAIFYGLGYSFEQHQQARDRIHRIGQRSKCTYLYLLSKGTVEEDILDVVRGKRSLHEMAMEFLSKGKETKRESRREAVAPGR